MTHPERFNNLMCNIWSIYGDLIKPGYCFLQMFSWAHWTLTSQNETEPVSAFCPTPRNKANKRQTHILPLSPAPLFPKVLNTLRKSLLWWVLAADTPPSPHIITCPQLWTGSTDQLQSNSEVCPISGRFGFTLKRQTLDCSFNGENHSICVYSPLIGKCMRRIHTIEVPLRTNCSANTKSADFHSSFRSFSFVEAAVIDVIVNFMVLMCEIELPGLHQGTNRIRKTERGCFSCFDCLFTKKKMS